MEITVHGPHQRPRMKPHSFVDKLMMSHKFQLEYVPGMLFVLLTLSCELAHSRLGSGTFCWNCLAAVQLPTDRQICIKFLLSSVFGIICMMLFAMWQGVHLSVSELERAGTRKPGMGISTTEEAGAGTVCSFLKSHIIFLIPKYQTFGRLKGQKKPAKLHPQCTNGPSLKRADKNCTQNWEVNKGQGLVCPVNRPSPKETWKVLWKFCPMFAS